MENTNKRTIESLVQILPGYNCGVCGFVRCDMFAKALLEEKTTIDLCKPLMQERFVGKRRAIQEILTGKTTRIPKAVPGGVIDKYEADFILKPLEGETSCREMLHIFAPIHITAGDIIRYRPLGCPITHIAEVVAMKMGLATVRIIGPRNRMGEQLTIKEAGICLVLGFEGTVSGDLPSVGATVRFVPGECMMQKVHSGVIVGCEGHRVVMECVDLKVWAPPVSLPETE